MRASSCRSAPEIRVGTAGWAIPREQAEHFPPEGSGLARYAARFGAAEINSSFHRPHRPSTYARWAETVPETFRFAVKLPKTVTHERRLVGAEALLDSFLAEIAVLGPKLGPLLVQLPPSLAFEAEVAASFFRSLAERSAAPLACEPRHPTWFTDEAGRLLAEQKVARVAADPARVPEAAEPGGWPGLTYYRLHGSPAITARPTGRTTSKPWRPGSVRVTPRPGASSTTRRQGRPPGTRSRSRTSSPRQPEDPSWSR